MKINTIDKINSTSVEKFLTTLRNKYDYSLETCNHYIIALKSFCNWLVKTDKLMKSPLLTVEKFNADSDRRHARRAMESEEFDRLLEAAKVGSSVESISGEDRVMLYIIAAWTGFRKGELGSVTLRHFKLDGEYPMLNIAASYSKRRREDVQYLHPDVVKYFRDWIAKKQFGPNDLLFPVSGKTCGVERKTSEMLKVDLESARKKWISEAKTAKEKEERSESDFLKYVDSRGRYADFHGLRHTFVSNLCHAGVSPKTAQTLARHSDISLTMNIYSHVKPEEQAAAINALPGLKKPR